MLLEGLTTDAAREFPTKFSSIMAIPNKANKAKGKSVRDGALIQTAPSAER